MLMAAHHIELIVTLGDNYQAKRLKILSVVEFERTVKAFRATCSTNRVIRTQLASKRRDSVLNQVVIARVV